MMLFFPSGSSMDSMAASSMLPLSSMGASLSQRRRRSALDTPNYMGSSCMAFDQGSAMLLAALTSYQTSCVANSHHIRHNCDMTCKAARQSRKHIDAQREMINTLGKVRKAVLMAKMKKEKEEADPRNRPPPPGMYT